MKYLAVAVISLLAGYFLYPVFHKPVAFEQFIQTEAKKYADATDADAKLKAADEMYGKMMLLLLAEVGVKTKPAEVKPVLFDAPENITECPPIIADQPKDNNVIHTAEATVASQPEAKKPVETPQDAWVKYTTTPYLETIKGKDRRMLGRFEGTLFRTRGREDSVVMMFNLNQSGKTIEGETLVLMTDPSGKQYSRNAGNGGNRVLKKGPADNSYYIEASPTSYFLVNLKHYPQISGKYFEKGKFIGDVQLRKVDL